MQASHPLYLPYISPISPLYLGLATAVQAFHSLQGDIGRYRGDIAEI